MAGLLPPRNVAQLRNFARYEKDQAFLRRYENAINRLVERRVGDRDVLWQFRAAVRRSGTPDESFMPRARLHRCKFRAWIPNVHAAYYSLLHGIVWNWWHYTNGVPGFENEKKRERHRRVAIAGLDRLRTVLKQGENICGRLDKGFYLRGKVLEKTDIQDQQEDNGTGTQGTAEKSESGAKEARP